MKKTIIIGAVIALGLAGLFFWGRASQTAEVVQSFGAISSLAAAEKLYDFGTISMRNGLVSHIFKVRNSANQAIKIKSVSTSCMCTSAYLESKSGEKGPFGMEGMGYVPPANEIVQAGETLDVKAVYDPNAHGPAGVGPIDRLIYLADESGNALQLEIKAVVTP